MSDFQPGDSVRFWTKEECIQLNGESVRRYFTTPDGPYDTWGEEGVIIRQETGNLYQVKFGRIEKAVGVRTLTRLGDTEEVAAIKILGEDYFK